MTTVTIKEKTNRSHYNTILDAIMMRDANELEKEYNGLGSINFFYLGSDIIEFHCDYESATQWIVVFCEYAKCTINYTITVTESRGIIYTP